MSQNTTAKGFGISDEDASVFMDAESQNTLLQLQSQLAVLKRENHLLREIGRPAVSNSVSSSLPKINLPERFDGSENEFRGFVNQLNLVFRLHACRYSTDEIKISVLGTLLTGRALQWFNPMSEHPEKYGTVMSSFPEFLRVFTAVFGPIDAGIKAANKITLLRQGRGTVSAYVSIFQQYAAELEWNDAALIHQFKSGLSGAVRNLLLHFEHTATLQETVALALRCDQRLLEEQLDRSSRFDALPLAANYRAHRPRASFAGPPAVPSPATPADSNAMEIDGIQRQSLPTPSRGPLTLEERTHRMNYGLCLVCGSDSHLRANCPKSRTSGKAHGQ
jgi:hypothetical protein